MNRTIDVYRVKEERERDLDVISWGRLLGIGAFVIFLPGMLWGAIIVLIAWEVFEPGLALGIGLGAFLVGCFQGLMTALVMAMIPSDWMKEIR